MQSEKEIKYEFNKIMMPFWRSGIMHYESVLMLQDEKGIPSAPLLFKPDRILSVKNSYLDTEYTEGDDFIYEDGMLKLVKGSKAPFFTIDEFFPSEPNGGFVHPRTDKGYLLVSNKEITGRQLAVTYSHSQTPATNLTPEWKGDMLPGTMEILNSGKSMKIALFGDSISVGYDTSGFLNIPPFMPDWGTLFVENIKMAYKIDVEFINPSVGGVTSAWGAENIESLVSVHEPDLVILAFGMNDGTWNVSPETFGNNIKAIMNNVLNYNKKAEFILVSPMLPNKLAAFQGDREKSFYGEQENYKQVLDGFAGYGAVVADMTSIHRELLKYKRYYDMTGNNINHPNDFLARWYAQLVSALILDDSRYNL